MGLADDLGITSDTSNSGTNTLASKLDDNSTPDAQPRIAPISNQYPGVSTQLNQAETINPKDLEEPVSGVPNPKANLYPADQNFNPVGVAENVFSKAGSAVGNAIPSVARQPIKSALELGTSVIEAPHQAIKNLAYQMANLGNELDTQGKPTENPLKSAWEGLTNAQMPQHSWADVITSDPNFMKGLPENDRQNAAKTLSVLPEFEADPAMYLKINGLTTAGEIAEKGGLSGAPTRDISGALEPTANNISTLTPKSEPLMGATTLQNYERGYKAPLTVGGIPLIPGKPVASFVRGTQNTLAKALDLSEQAPIIGGAIKGTRNLAQSLGEGFNPMTNNPEFNDLAQKNINANQAETLYSNIDTAENQRIIRDHAEAEGVSPDQLRQNILDYIEPAGSQSEEYDPVAIQQAKQEAYQKLSPDMQAFADEIGQMHEERAGAEQQRGLLNNQRENYIEHQQTPEAKDWWKNNIPEEDKQQFQGAISKINSQERGVGHTINEANNLFSEGRGSEVNGLGKWKVLDDFKGKFFNDKVEDLAADRYLRSSKATNDHDFLQDAGKTYGRSEEAVKASDNPMDFVPVTRPSFKDVAGAKDNTLFFPREIGNYLKRTDRFTTNNKYINSIINGLTGLNSFTKKMNFGIWPGSAVKIELGNQKLAWLSDLWDPHSQLLGHSIATHIRQGTLDTLDDTKPILFSPKLGPLTEKQVYQLAIENRGINMGLAQKELESMRPQEQGMMHGLTEPMWQLHNYVEDGTRMGTFINALKNGYTAEAAGRATQNALYDYSKLGPIPNTARQFVPFFTFAYKNAPAMLGKFAENPGKLSLYSRAKDIVNQPVQDQDKYNKEWQVDNMPIYMGTAADGKNYYLYGNKFMPETDMNEFLGSGKTIWEALENTPGKMLKYTFSMQNPELKTLLEEGFKESVYFDQAIQHMKGEQAQTGLGFDAPSKVAYAIRNTVRAPSEVGRLSDTTNPFGLRLAHAIGGFNIQGIDPVAQQENYVYDLERQIKGGGKTGGEADMHHYGALYARYKATGDEAKAELALKNFNQAVQNIKDAIAKSQE